MTPSAPRADLLAAADLPLSRRTLLQAVALLGAAGMVGVRPPAAAAAQRGSSRFAAQFADPATRHRAGFRWWWPHGLVDPVEIAREVDQVADAGFGLLEIADVHHSVGQPLSPETHGWGTAPWREAVEAALVRARQRGLRIDMTIGPSWPAAAPTITADDPRAAQELVHGVAEVPGGSTFDGAAPEPAVPASDGVTNRRLVLVQAARVSSRPSGRPVVLEAGSVVDLEAYRTGEHVSWTAPGGGEWVVIAYWQRGSGQRPERGPHTEPVSWVVDHFSESGSAAVVDYWDEAVLTPRIRELLQDCGGNIFEDSLEMETHATLWTHDALEQFELRAGYDLRPYLPTVLEHNERYVFSLDAETSTQVRSDLGRVLGELYLDRHIRPLQEWARALGLGLRVQCYGMRSPESDSVAQAAVLDVPEGESLGFKNLDDYRILASGRDIAGRDVLSCEAACYAGGAYSTTWQRALGTLGSIMAAGVSQHVLHGFSYRDVTGAAWPGFAAFSPYDGRPGYGESWGPRMPSWKHVRPIADHLARTQLVLQTGRPRVDVAVFRQRGASSTGIGAGYFTNDGIPVGWSHGFLTAAVMDVVEPVVKDGRLYPDGPAYKAVVLAGDRFAGQAKTIPLSAARRLRDLARQGLRVVVVGDWSQARGTGRSTPAADEEIRTLIRELESLPNTATVPDDASIPQGLEALGVTREVEHERSTLMHVHRHAGDVDLFYVANARHAENRRIQRVEQDVWFTTTVADAVPYRLDAWTGRIERIALYERDGSRFKIKVELNPGESALIGLGGPSWFADAGRRPLHAVASDADLVRFEDADLVLRSSKGGALTTTLSSGGTVTTQVDRVPAPLTLDAWHLEVEDWLPGERPWQTRVEVRHTDLDALVPWTQIPGLEDASGIGRYTTRVELPAGWPGNVGAYLDLGAVFDTVRVTVNGFRVPDVSPLVRRIDLGKLLRKGVNTVQVEVSTTLLNRLRTTMPGVFGSSSRQSYGLLGPVTVVPYREAVVR